MRKKPPDWHKRCLELHEELRHCQRVNEQLASDAMKSCDEMNEARYEVQELKAKLAKFHCPECGGLCIPLDDLLCGCNVITDLPKFVGPSFTVTVDKDGNTIWNGKSQS